MRGSLLLLFAAAALAAFSASHASGPVCYEYKVSTTSDPNATWHTFTAAQAAQKSHEYRHHGQTRFTAAQAAQKRKN